MSKSTLTNTVNYLSHSTPNWIEEYKYIFDYSDYNDIAYAYAKKTHNEQDLAFLLLFYTRTLFEAKNCYPWQFKEIDNKLNYMSQSASPLGTLTKQIRRLVKKSSTYSNIEIDKQLFDLANEARDLGFKIPYHFSNFKQAVQDVELAKPDKREEEVVPVNHSWVLPVGGVISLGIWIYTIAPELLVFFFCLGLFYFVFKDVLNNNPE